MNRIAAVDWQGGISSAWQNVADFLPKLLVALVILVVGYFVAKAVEKLLDRVLERVGFDRWVERGGIKRALAQSQLDASSILSRIVFYALMLIVLSMAFGVFGDNPISLYLAAAVAYLPKVFVAVLIVVIATAIASAVRTLIQSSLGGLSYGRTLAGAAWFLIVALGVIAALDQLEIAQNVVNAVLYASLAALVGVVVVAVGGGGIQPMQDRWRRTLDRYDEEKGVIAERMGSARDDMRHEYAPTGVMQDPVAVSSRPGVPVDDDVDLRSRQEREAVDRGSEPRGTAY